jgi:transposase InsO family protein
LKNRASFFSNYTTRDEDRKDIVDYSEMFDNCRRWHSYWGYVSPGEFEKRQFLKKDA